ncbi:MAG: hypothetical protein NTX22_01145 [Ignavibacteriales bacterium]|nr:hypothetical protein [Ignavibacteriales bacterium]
MSKIFFFLSLCVILFSGCSHIYIREDYSSDELFIEDINQQCERRNVLITKKNNEKTYATELNVQSDTIIFKTIDESSFLTNKSSILLPLKDVESLKYNDHFDGGVKGFCFGFLSGSLLGPAFIKYSKEGTPSLPVKSMMVGSLVGCLTGIILGTIIGCETTFILDINNK